MSKTVRLLRVAYWWGIIADAVSATLMLFPETFLRVSNINLVPDRGFGEGVSYAVPLMLAWTFLLLWADRRPVERRDVLLLTLPVIAGYAWIEVNQLRLGQADFVHTLPQFISQAGLTILFIVGHRMASRLEKTAPFGSTQPESKR